MIVDVEDEEQGMEDGCEVMISFGGFKLVATSGGGDSCGAGIEVVKAGVVVLIVNGVAIVFDNAGGCEGAKNNCDDIGTMVD